MRRRAPRPLAAALGAFATDIAPATPLARVQAAWERAVGARVARAAQPTAERGGVLTVTCAAAVWAHELGLMEHELLAHVNEAVGEQLVHALRCRAG